MKKNSKIYIAGHKGMVGSAIKRKLESRGYNNILNRTSSELDLRNQLETEFFFEKERPEYIFLAAAKVGGIVANDTLRAEYLYDNLLIAANVINAAHKTNAKKLLFLGSSCIYPRNAPQPLKEEYLLSGRLEQTNEPYSIAKIAGIKLCEAYRSQYGSDFISVMPCNLYGTNDNYHPYNSHVLPALIRKFHEAKESGDAEVILWGSGTPRREFLFADDLADACFFLMTNYSEPEPVNIGSGEDLTISDLSKIIKDVVGFKGKVSFDKSRPDGTPRKLLDVSRIRQMGWRHTVLLEDGIALAYADFLRKTKHAIPEI